MLGVKTILNKVFDKISRSLAVRIAGQLVSLLVRLAGVEQSVAVLDTGRTIGGGDGDFDFDELEFSGYSQIDFLLKASVAAGKYTVRVMQSQDGTNYESVRFSVNGGSEVTEFEVNAGDPVPILLNVRRVGKDCKVRITPDGTNDVTVSYLWGTRRVL